MALDFPSSPVDGQVYNRYTYNSTYGTWKLTKTGVAFSESNTAPVSPNVGDLWVDLSDGTEYTYVSDLNGSQWVELSSSSITGTQGPAGPTTIIQNSQTSAYQLTSADNGKYIDITTGGISIVTATGMTAGQNAMIYNNSSSTQTITQGAGVTLRQAGTTNTGNRTIAQYGIATILCVGNNIYVISGSGLF
jgi:hypothetical protein